MFFDLSKISGFSPTEELYHKWGVSHQCDRFAKGNSIFLFVPYNETADAGNETQNGTQNYTQNGTQNETEISSSYVLVDNGPDWTWNSLDRSMDFSFSQNALWNYNK
jgi:hypothetical protein